MPYIIAANAPSPASRPVDNNARAEGTRGFTATLPTIKLDEGGDGLCRHPTLNLPTASISDVTAARLTCELLHHVLFLKSQVPFPIAQLARIATSARQAKQSAKAVKKRTELLETLDELECHLISTFTALGTALALTRPDSNSTLGRRGTGRACLQILLGPSINAPKARVILGFDGVDVKVWGVRRDSPGAALHPESADLEDDSASESTDSVSESSDVESETSEDDEVLLESSFSASSSALDDASSAASSASESPPPSPSISPSPSPSPSRSPSPSIIATQSQSSSPVPSSPVDVHGKSAGAITSAPRPSAEKRSPKLDFSPANMGSPPRQTGSRPPTRTEQEAALRAAERALGRTLAERCADEDEGWGDDLPPTQTHILLRAPRRFAHPAWTPKAQHGDALDAALQDFLAEPLAQAATEEKKPTRSKGGRSHGLWIRAACDTESYSSEKDRGPGEGEEDEEIWWAWDGKIVGFSDW